MLMSLCLLFNSNSANSYSYGNTYKESFHYRFGGVNMESETRRYDNIGVCTFTRETCSTNFDYKEVPKITGVHTIPVLSATLLANSSGLEDLKRTWLVFSYSPSFQSTLFFPLNLLHTAIILLHLFV